MKITQLDCIKDHHDKQPYMITQATGCILSFCFFNQHLHERTEGTASSAQLQNPRLSRSQRQIPGTLLFMSYPHCVIIVTSNNYSILQFQKMRLF